jgi:hypothetical protein
MSVITYIKENTTSTLIPLKQQTSSTPIWVGPEIILVKEL